MKKNLLIPIVLLIPFSCIQTGTELLIDTPEIAELTFVQDREIHEEIIESDEKDFTPEKIIQAYKRAYSDKISEITYKNDDWAMKVYDQWYYWADGRLLPEELVLQKEKYNPHIFNHYPEDLPPFQELPEDFKKRIDSIVEERKKNPIQRHPGFLNSLWRIYDRDTSWARVKTTYFLGYKLQIHRDLLEDLAQVEEEIQRRMLVDRELREFTRSLGRIDGYNWRRIADTDTLSVHSYGIALDLILNYNGREEIYWLWTHNKGVKFYDQPYSRRFSPPDSFIKAFERNGFIWGGKWLFYDTIHFEYRPEILILNGLMD
jgi:D-alanyl-D-alanine carboxypeptidase